jgi:hypothetical protein
MVVLKRLDCGLVALWLILGGNKWGKFSAATRIHKALVTRSELLYFPNFEICLITILLWDPQG